MSNLLKRAVALFGVVVSLAKGATSTPTSALGVQGAG